MPIPRGMRVLLACLAALALSGCFVFEELDAGMEIMEAHTPASQKKKKAEEEKAAEGEKPPTYAEKTRQWWGSASSLSSSDEASDDPTVPCEVDGSTLFTKRSACLARGGRPG